MFHDLSIAAKNEKDDFVSYTVCIYNKRKEVRHKKFSEREGN